MQSEAQQLVGAVFSARWRLMRLIGEGGMGAVYEAHSTRGEGVRAIKVLHPEFMTEPQVLNRFFAEAQAVQMLSHPNVAQIYEAQRAEDGTPYLVMELLSGTPLSSFRKPGQPIPTNQAAPIAYGMLQALALAHSRGIIHRDLKPDNLFLVPGGGGQFVVKVLDFGIAKVMDAAGGMGSKTKTGVLLGTPGYMSPEQIKNSKAVDPRSDLWSVGIILYEMLTGREAFPADNEFTRLTAVLTQDITPIGQVNPGLTSWAGFFQRALSKDPAGRFGSANEMAQALMASAGQGKSPSAQGRDWGTVMLQLPGHSPSQPPPGPATGVSPQGYGQRPSAPPMPGSLPYAGPMSAQHSQQQPQHAPGFSRGSTQLAGMSANPISIHVPPASAQPPARMPSTPPPGSSGPSPYGPSQGPTGPATHVSGQRPPGMPAIPSQPPPQIPVVVAPPVGFPLWVVIAVGVGAFVLGLALGAIAF